MAYFAKIGGAFRVGKAKWLGPVVASPDAIYLVKKARQRNNAGGGLIGAAISAALQSRDRFDTCRYFELPAEVTSHSDWPVKRKKDCRVLIIPKNEIKQIKHPGFTNVLRLEFQGTDIRIDYLMFRGRFVKEFLHAGGWPLLWRGVHVGSAHMDGPAR